MPILFLGATTNGYDGSLLNGLQAMDPWQEYFGHPNGSTLGLSSAILQIGAFSAIFFCMSHQTYVRGLFLHVAQRRTLPIFLAVGLDVTVGIVILIGGVILQVVPGVTTSMYIGGMFLVGLGSNTTQGSAPLLIMELAHPQHRGKITTMYNTLWYCGSIVAAWTCYGTTSYSTNMAWRIPTAVMVLMPALQLLGVWALPESPRWLVSKDRHEQALTTLAKYHSNGNTQDPFVQWELSSIKDTLQMEKENSKQGWQVLLQTKGHRRRVLLLAPVSFFSQCSGNGMVSYYLHSILNSVGMTDPHDQALFNGGLQIWSFFVAICFSVFLVDKFGRRKLFLIAAVGMLVTFTIWTACSAVFAKTGNAGAGKAVLAMIFLFYGVAGFAWPGLTVSYAVEILPYNIRAKGQTSLASLFNQYVNPIGLERIAWKFYFVYIVILVIEVITIYLIFPETRGLTLEEVGHLLDDDSKHSSTQSSEIEEKSDVELVEYAEGKH
ncbi:hypothetical protein AUEXF2481DRAFT_48200 [Aureobasidium subglaciale EXF-2481]|uniref:Major facilitator superfamily (MFS) profile domain-containing protein n=1 Tax=Aureobasidium subglaciale (strain EXF-2481) TaxID=1043005 RepID=A0A074Y297_AURSE|nr:uncharacterized protein AUEXF2481DRAFT_48200 [Aureobasidium subglaciale EXF-2481]KEQ91840.1 hypothetical protein AUEXF2481DRAFT_48200 [Aureobasidium subglaciale EXF-2481]